MTLSDPETPKLHANLTITIVILIASYASLVGGLIGSVMFFNDPSTAEGIYTGIGCTICLLVVQLLFVFTAGTKDLVEPVRPAKRIFPLIVFAILTAMLVGGLSLALAELLGPYAPQSEAFFWLYGVAMIASWIFWLVTVIILSNRSLRVTFFRRIAQNLLAGSLLELLITIPAHLVVSRRPGCLVGIGTMVGIFSGVIALVFSGGPAIAWVMMRTALTEREKSELRRQKRKNI